MAMFEIKEIPGPPRWKFNNIAYLVTPTKPTQIGNIEFKPRPHFMPKVNVELLQEYQNFKVRDDDVWIVTYGKCGTTWMQELCWLIVNNYDFDTAKNIDLELRSPFFEYNTLVSTDLLNTLKLLEESTTRRVIKTHFGVGLIPKETWTKKSKIIHLIRDPRDAALSAYHMMVGRGTFEGTLEEFLKSYLSRPVCNIWHHTLEFWKLKNFPKYLLITYEEMKKDLESVINKICDFLDQPITEEEMKNMMHHLSFENMKRNDKVNHNLESTHIASIMKKTETSDFKFLRAGQVGNHRTEFPEEYKQMFKEWIETNLKDTDFKFYREN